MFRLSTIHNHSSKFYERQKSFRLPLKNRQQMDSKSTKAKVTGENYTLIPFFRFVLCNIWNLLLEQSL